MIKKLSILGLLLGMTIFDSSYAISGVLTGFNPKTGSVFEVEEPTGVYCEINGEYICFVKSRVGSLSQTPYLN